MNRETRWMRRDPNGRNTSKTANWDAAKKSLDVVQKRVNLRLKNGIKAVC
jgi:hypothetical protein